MLILQEILPLPDDIFSFSEGSDENLMCVSCRLDTQYSQPDFYNSRSERGMAVFWNTKPQISVNICDPHDHFMLTNIPCDNYTFCLANMYMPCDDRAADSICLNKQTLGELQQSLESNNVSFTTFISIN